MTFNQNLALETDTCISRLIHLVCKSHHRHKNTPHPRNTLQAGHNNQTKQLK